MAGGGAEPPLPARTSLMDPRVGTALILAARVRTDKDPLARLGPGEPVSMREGGGTGELAPRPSPKTEADEDNEAERVVAAGLGDNEADASDRRARGVRVAIRLGAVGVDVPGAARVGVDAVDEELPAVRGAGCAGVRRTGERRATLRRGGVAVAASEDDAVAPTPADDDEATSRACWSRSRGSSSASVVRERLVGAGMALMRKGWLGEVRWRFVLAPG